MVMKARRCERGWKTRMDGSLASTPRDTMDNNNTTGSIGYSLTRAKENDRQMLFL